ncbi:MAG TPA: antibiotic biosynthesis monooxygenase family protein [Flavipsychrobacter sp.]|nr:antibiotic biosynthesis monooxygenase family protein [Flavipsychrobacter sp.]
MILRIVKMHFREEEIPNFLQLFEERRSLIRSFEGCEHLELWQDEQDKHIFFTYSHWQSETHLNHYRFSALFKDTWAQTKLFFADKPQAWSVNRKVVMGASW